MSEANEEETSVDEAEKELRPHVRPLAGLLRDGLAAQEVIRGLRGKERKQVEAILVGLGEKGTERDIQQMGFRTDELDGDVYRALNHLIWHRSSYLGHLVKLARHGYEWRKLPLLSSF